jgi:thiosulfate/3-mercaptopyruvate sulfurtransferase
MTDMLVSTSWLETHLGDADHVIAYCGYGIAASATVFVLTMLGHRRTALYDGSLAQWAPDQSLPMVTGAP